MEDETTVNHLARLCNSKTSRIVPGTRCIVYLKLTDYYRYVLYKIHVLRMAQSR
jgi:hypothetical protein